jgi:hypothetical protein
MRKTVWGGGNGNGRTRNGSQEWEWSLRGGGNGNGRTRNGSLPLTVLISSRDLDQQLMLVLVATSIVWLLLMTFQYTLGCSFFMISLRLHQYLRSLPRRLKMNLTKKSRR